MLPSDIATVSSTLTTLQVDPDVVHTIVGVLRGNADGIDDIHPGSLPAAVLGASSAGELLGYHTGLARQKVVEAMADMVAGLNGYADRVAQHASRVGGVDDDHASDLRRGAAATEHVAPSFSRSTGCAAAPDFHDNPACTLPTEGS